LDGYHRQIAFNNIRNAFGEELSPSECHRLVRDCFCHLMILTFELPSLLRINKNNVDSYVEFQGGEYLKQALATRKGFLFLTGHVGNWELMALAASVKFQFSMYVMVRPLDIESLDRFITDLRSCTGNIVLDKDNSAGSVRELLKANQVIGILLDQNASWYEGVYVPFFGRIACTNKGLAMFAIRYNVPVIPAFNFRMKDGRYRIIFSPPVEPIRTGDITNDIIETTALYNRIIEKHIRMAPDNWLWVHRRWRMKHIPESARKKIKGQIDFTLT
jgi:KDO2-lipid IV(A) lauroyltransferase